MVLHGRGTRGGGIDDAGGRRRFHERGDAERRLVPVGDYLVYTQSPSVASHFRPTKRRRTSTPEEEDEEQEDGAPEADAGGGDGGGAGATPPEEEDGDDKMLARLKRKALETVQEEDARPSSQEDAAEARRGFLHLILQLAREAEGHLVRG